MRRRNAPGLESRGPEYVFVIPAPFGKPPRSPAPYAGDIRMHLPVTGDSYLLRRAGVERGREYLELGRFQSSGKGIGHEILSVRNTAPLQPFASTFNQRLERDPGTGGGVQHAVFIQQQSDFRRETRTAGEHFFVQRAHRFHHAPKVAVVVPSATG